ncbi:MULTISPECIES: DoxX family protein [unclassified Moraxella]|uniref:DoxX family protein n=1 Tax=unclassified Moraxella TaxID=2685852 RepID=UPI003AF49F59
MKTAFSGMATHQPYFLGILRIVAGYCFFLHGTQKLFGIPATDKVIDLASLMGASGILEFILGGMILVGFQTRLAGFLASGMIAIGYFIAHAKLGNFWLPLQNRGEAAVLFCFIFLYLWSAGGGKWALDNLLAKHK